MIKQIKRNELGIRIDEMVGVVDANPGFFGSFIGRFRKPEFTLSTVLIKYAEIADTERTFGLRGNEIFVQPLTSKDKANHTEGIKSDTFSDFMDMISAYVDDRNWEKIWKGMLALLDRSDEGLNVYFNAAKDSPLLADFLALVRKAALESESDGFSAEKRKELQTVIQKLSSFADN